jgi:hypothetical protein
MEKGIKTENKQWQKPELTVLVRSKPEEAVLGACKQFNQSGPGGAQYWCGRDCVTCYDKLKS